MHNRADDFTQRHPLLTALALSMGTAISLGLARFSYALLLPPMRADLGWSYLLAGAMNTGNALGYLLGALATPFLMRRFGMHAVLIGGSLLTAVFMLLSGFVTDAGALLLQRVLAGIASAFVFIAGGAHLGGAARPLQGRAADGAAQHAARHCHAAAGVYRRAAFGFFIRHPVRRGISFG